MRPHAFQHPVVQAPRGSTAVHDGTSTGLLTPKPRLDPAVLAERKPRSRCPRVSVGKSPSLGTFQG